MPVRPAKDLVVFLDTLTAESFMSGAVSKQGAEATKLLPQLHEKCLVVKDLTALFSMKHDLVRKILGDLQSIYDGEYSKAIGTGFDGKAALLLRRTDPDVTKFLEDGVLIIRTGRSMALRAPEHPDNQRSRRAD
jgi:hypothetical protein